MMAGSYTSLGATVGDLDTAANDRLSDAEKLLSSRRYPSAIAMGLYALEIRLKERICRRLDLDQLPRPFETHDLSGLLVLSGLRRRLDDPSNARVKANWELIERESKFLNELRYKPNSFRTRSQALSFIAQLRDHPDGVLPWISIQP
jgi:HEPN domain-containing protein